MTDNHRDYAPLVNAPLQAREPLVGVVFTADRSLPRNKATIAVMVRLLDDLLRRSRQTETLEAGISWLTEGVTP